jgi:preprotein translocase subunit YajC
MPFEVQAASQREASNVELQIGDKVVTNSGRLGKVVQAWAAIACVEVMVDKSRMTISYPSNQLVRLQPTRTESLQLMDGDRGCS